MDELTATQAQSTQVTGLHMASTDTDMMSSFDIPKNTLHTRAVKATLSDDPAEVYPQAVRHSQSQAA